VRRVIAAAAKKKREDDAKPLISPRRSATQVLTRGADQILPRHNIISLKALEMDGLIERSGSRPLNQKDLLKLYSCRRL
jgi:hypothetical protein